MVDATAATAPPAENAEEFRREAFTMGLYVAICVLAALIAGAEADSDLNVVKTIWGITVGLAVAHWFAFRMSTRLVRGGQMRDEDLFTAGAQILGAIAVAVPASFLAVVVPDPWRLRTAELVLGGLIGGMGFAVARSGGVRHVFAVGFGIVVLALSIGIAILKDILAGH